MSADWFVRFKGEAVPPTKEEIGSLLCNYFDAAASEIRWERDRYYVTLHGSCSFPFAELAPDVADPYKSEKPRERWIEVWLDRKDGTVDVITRMMDNYTNALASDVAGTIARFWHGELDDDDDD